MLLLDEVSRSKSLNLYCGAQTLEMRVLWQQQESLDIAKVLPEFSSEKATGGQGVTFGEAEFILGLLNLYWPPKRER